jgi:hypothetical protein
MENRGKTRDTRGTFLNRSDLAATEFALSINKDTWFIK